MRRLALFLILCLAGALVAARPGEEKEGMFPWVSDILAGSVWSTESADVKAENIVSNDTPVPSGSMEATNNLDKSLKEQRQHHYQELFPNEAQLVHRPLHPPLRGEAGESDSERLERQKYEGKRSSAEKDFSYLYRLIEAVDSNQEYHLIPFIRSQLIELIDAGADYAVPVFAFIGLQGMGKSFVMNTLTRIGCAFSQAKVATKAPVLYQLRTSMGGEEEVEIMIPGRPPVYVTYAELTTYLGKLFKSMPEVSSEQMSVKIRAKWVPADVDFLDVPGIVSVSHLADRTNTVTDTVRSLASQSNIVFVLINDITASPETQSDVLPSLLRDAGVPQSRVINVLNKANLMPSQALSVADSYDRITDWWDILRSTEVPFIIGPDKDKTLINEWDQMSGTPEEEVARWTGAAQRGDAMVSTWIRDVINPHALRTKSQVIPDVRVGVANLMAHITKMINEDMFRAIDGMVQTWQRKQEEQEEQEEE